MKYKDYYGIMGLDKKATSTQIKQAYRKLAKKYHPDTNPGDKKMEEKFKELNEAYEVLGDPDKKKKYDNIGSGTNFGNGYDFDPSQYGFGSNKGYEYRTSSANNFSDFFNTIFGEGSGFDRGGIFRRAGGAGGAARGAATGKSGGAYSYAVQGSDLEAEIGITVEEGFRGADKMISLNVDGHDKTISFKIPAGIRQDERIRLAGQGNPGYGGGGRGDLYLKVRFVNGGRFILEGNDLTAVADLMPWEAALGAEIPFETIDDRIMVKIPPGIQSDSRIRVAGKGYRDRNDTRGNLFIKIRIMNPPVLSKEEKELFEKLKSVSEFRPH